ncbi:hypothetical protein KJS94_05190 [Flavihumibacter rivuli]|uniref:hypothetical protein n=1 Tax=Flavihumibacter rivuli TaxID=2838156 RepID=UPI001BDF0F2A|nr:hypothetical protein [Flavihumibacter rivuli]ULQ57593.1 hypothetical protein KJS94_05190 [Flavihumibacter rivuli]
MCKAIRKVVLVVLMFGGMVMLANGQSNTVTYPRVAGYVGILHPIVGFSEGKSTFNFDNYYLVGLPTGINLWKSSKVGFSVEFVPFVRADSTGSRMSNFLFHPGVLFALGKGWTLAGRLAFETSGRFGATPVINKVVKKNKHSSYFVAMPLPMRFGNSHAFSFTIGFQFGVSF